MAFTLLSVDDFLGMEFKSNMSRMDYLLAVSEVAWLKSMSGEEDNLIVEQDKQFCIKKKERITHNIQSILSTFPAVLDHQEESILDFVIPKGKRSRPRKVIEPFLCNGGELMIKKAVENNFEEQKHSVKAYEEENRKFKINIGAGVINQGFFCLKESQKYEEGENSAKAADQRENTVFKFNWTGSVNFAFENPKRQLPIIRKRSRDLANDTLGFINQERGLNEKSEATREKKKAKKNIVRVLPIEFKNVITEFGGSVESAILVIEKTLFNTDVKPAEGRLSIPLNQITIEFLRPHEKAKLNTRSGGKLSTMRVMLIEPSRRICEINLRKWNMNKINGISNSSYVLVTTWNEVTRRNALKRGTLVQLWSFRKDEELCFALVKV
ncbi:putative B3 domain-containing protein At5g35780 [Lycium ferocissimum]|uniref:putative B3 domain-containing protein At5g35780 n=1 Tax=Lycium ferocissimum TaxID=112874 RepID=UPI002814FDE9|nr:putative B3 domain-containing protein At5g35780 [Lycium ferocissimum]